VSNIPENAQGTAEPPTILLAQPRHYTIATWNDDVGIVHWMGQADGRAMTRVHETFEPVLRTHPRAVSFVHLVEGGAGLPDAEARSALTAMMSSFSDKTACVGVVLMGNGFWASAMQSLLTGMRLLAPPRPWPMRFAAESSELSGWVVNMHDLRTLRTLDPDALHAALQYVQRMSQDTRGAANG